MSAAEHLAEAIDVGCTRDDHDHIAMHRAEVLAEAADFVGNDDTCDCGGCDSCVPNKLAAGLRAMADPTKAARMQDAADTLAARRGTARRDFYEPGHTYADPDSRAYDWRFRCDMVTTHPEDGERTALGWRHFKGVWEPYAYGEDDWDVQGFVGTTDQPEAPRG
ncbi:hypothetical protein ACIPRU_15650 [Streptomyces sp. NPDC090126]|uniref:hypothetical protein n=1 Tax=Streptomyces sp. NPDC090126 TaxID=3365952 RepID=UPI00382BF20C